MCMFIYAHHMCTYHLYLPPYLPYVCTYPCLLTFLVVFPLSTHLSPSIQIYVLHMHIHIIYIYSLTNQPTLLDDGGVLQDVRMVGERQHQQLPLPLFMSYI